MRALSGFTMVLLAFAFVGLLLTGSSGCKGCGEDEVAEEEAKEAISYTSTGVIGAGGGEVSIKGIDSRAIGSVASGAGLSFPSGALDEDTEIEMEYAEDGKGGHTLSLKPDGLKFAKPATLSFKVDRNSSEGRGWDSRKLRVFREVVVDGGSVWLPLPSKVGKDGQVSAEIQHFSYYAIWAPKTLMKTCTATDASIPAVLLVHGWQPDPKREHPPGDTWGELSPESKGGSILTRNNPDLFVEYFSYYSHDPIEEIACLLGEAIENLRSAHVGREVVVVAHSMGGLVTRTYIQGLAERDGTPCPYKGGVASVVTLGTPHGGANAADVIKFTNQATNQAIERAKLLIPNHKIELGMTWADGLEQLRSSTDNMERGSSFLNRLNGCKGGNCSRDGRCDWDTGSARSFSLPYLAIQGKGDWVVSPPGGSVAQNVDPDCRNKLDRKGKEPSPFKGYGHFRGDAIANIDDEDHPSFVALCDWLDGCEIGSVDPEKDAACKASEVCKKYGRCTAGGDCHATSDADCRASTTSCKEWGRCTAKDGSNCLATSDADCKASTRCKKSGMCTLKSEVCVKTPGNKFTELKKKKEDKPKEKKAQKKSDPVIGETVMTYKMDLNKGTLNTDTNKFYPGKVIIDLEKMEVFEEGSSRDVIELVQKYHLELSSLMMHVIWKGGLRLSSGKQSGTPLDRRTRNSPIGGMRVRKGSFVNLCQITAQLSNSQYRKVCAKKKTVKLKVEIIDVDKKNKSFEVRITKWAPL
jgi:pimeloyl-ACP methyl ester carboxylesterase